MIEDGINEGLRQAAELAREGIRSIALDGWAVDYVRLDANGKAVGDPFVIATSAPWLLSGH